MDSRDAIVKKYNNIAPRYSERYADPGSVARRTLDLVRSWGRPAEPGDSILELACADGFITTELVRSGFEVTALDIAPRMIEVATERLARARLEADLRTQDIETFRPTQDFDVVMGAMREFFLYVTDARKVIERLADHTRKKLLVDLNPRQTDLQKALDDVRAAGFDSVEWRGFFVPTRFRTGAVVGRLLRGAEVTPVLRSALLQWKFTVVIKGERLV
jgi:2-polyprenyl-3-methyl-5-hydroxy-6-metoxy-1,4-benzoquinol methylase